MPGLPTLTSVIVGVSDEVLTEVFSTELLPSVVEDESGLGNGADAVGAETEVFECPPALGELGGGAFTADP